MRRKERFSGQLHGADTPPAQVVAWSKSVQSLFIFKPPWKKSHSCFPVCGTRIDSVFLRAVRITAPS